MKEENVSPPIHPGLYIKSEIIPENMSVKDAAEILGVGRPALSNLLNGNSSLSTEMILRLEKSFGASKEKLLSLQTEYVQYEMSMNEKEIAVRTYSPSFFDDVQAREIEAWSEKLEARSLLPVLMRRLINTTGKDLSQVDFPAYENIQRHGWDGRVESGSVTPWIPRGISGWELSVRQDVSSKARSDYESRTEKISPNEKKQTSFVFVTPRNWPGKNDWVKEQKDKNKWKDIKVYDASDLEQWLEQSVPAQAWFREKLGKHDDNIFSLDQCWRKWSMVTEPNLNRELFSDAVKTNREKLEGWLRSSEENSLIVVADSKDEAVAFLSCAFQDLGNWYSYYDKVLCVYSSKALKKAARGNSQFIAIVASEEAEKALPEVKDRVKAIIVCNKAAVINPGISLEMPSHDCFRESLVSMGISSQDVFRYSRESGQSPTVLRRRLSDIPSVKSPDWARKSETVRSLIPFMFVGAWNAENVADRQVLSRLSDLEGHEEVERIFAEMLQLEESPLWSISNYRGVVSKIDTLFLVRNSITKQDIEHFFDVAKAVLSEDDPVLDLPEEKRWMANIYGKTRKHSSYLREGVCETLVLLSVNGDNLFRKRTGINVQREINSLIRGLLKPLDPRTWMSQRDDLPRYAEAAPEEFLEILKDDLRNESPKISSLLKPADSAIFGVECARTGLLWALELLAWKPERLLEVAGILARLSKTEIEDNWINKPFNSLVSIFRSWMPQTKATLDQRIAGLRYIARKYPHIGWQLCVNQLFVSQTGDYNCRPRWRNDATGAGEPLTDPGEVHIFRREALDILLNWKPQNEETLTDLLAYLGVMNEGDIEKVLHFIDEWSGENPSDEKKAYLREQIRKYMFTMFRHENLDEKTKNLFQAMYDQLGPKDLIMRHQWLFACGVADSLDEGEEGWDYKRNFERINSQRLKALREIHTKLGFPGLKRLLDITEDSANIGLILAKNIFSEKEAKDFLYMLISDSTESLESKINGCVSGFLHATDLSRFNEIINTLTKKFKEESTESELSRLLILSPFNENTWKHVERLPEDLQKAYWKSVRPFGRSEDPEFLRKIVDKLLEVDRPREALGTVYLSLDKIDSRRILSLLYQAIVNHTELSELHEVYPHTVTEAFEILNSRDDVLTDEIAELEFLYLRYIYDPKFKTPNLEKRIEDSPQLFVQILALAFRRSDDGEDPSEWRVEEDIQRVRLANAATSLLHSIKRIPGMDETGIINEFKLKNWIEDVRTLCDKYARKGIGDQTIGQILSSCFVGDDGIWPCEPIRRILDDVGSEQIAIGMSIGVRNARGVTTRGFGDGGNQERDLAAKYRDWSKKLSFEYPYVTKLLEEIACQYDFDAQHWDTREEIEKRTRL